MAQDDLAGISREEAERRVREALDEAERARRQRQYNRGIELLLDVLKYKAQADAVYYRLGNLYFDAGDLGRAEYAYRRAIETNPRHVNAHHNLAVVYKKLGRIDESVRMQKRAVRLQAGGWIGRVVTGKPASSAASPAVEGVPVEWPGESPGSDEASGPETADASVPETPGASVPETSDSSGSDTTDKDPFGTVYVHEPWGGEAPAENYFDPRIHDPEGFRRFGKRVAFAGILVFFGVGIAFLALLYVVGFWLF